MIADGLVDEVKGLLAEEKPLSKQARCAIGYAEIIDYLSSRHTMYGSLAMSPAPVSMAATQCRTAAESIWARMAEHLTQV
jgi:tRNA A37 N6-isopentenylltransferase MiaA